MRFDEGRQADLKLIDERLKLPIRDSKRETLEKTRESIINQKNNPQLNELRKRLFRARRNGDQAVGDKIEELMRNLELNHKL